MRMTDIWPTCTVSIFLWWCEGMVRSVGMGAGCRLLAPDQYWEGHSITQPGTHRGHTLEVVHTPHSPGLPRGPHVSGHATQVCCSYICYLNFILKKPWRFIQSTWMYSASHNAMQCQLQLGPRIFNRINIFVKKIFRKYYSPLTNNYLRLYN